MKNKLILIITWVLSAIIALITVFFIKDDIKPENVNPLTDKEILFNMWMHQIVPWKDKVDFNNEDIKNNIEDYIENLYTECKNITYWSGTNLIQWYWFLERYNDALYLIDNNEYIDKNNLVDWNCSEFTWENKLHCEVFASKDLKVLETNKEELPLYNYILLKSLISKENLCKNLLTNVDQDDCEATYKDYISELEENSKPITMYSTKMELWKFLSINGVEKYKEIIDISFIDRCNYYVKDFTERIYNTAK